jgi:two-component system chemotaxis response regulator CheB
LISLKPKQLIFIAASTGGPGLIETILISLKAPINATVVLLQHMDRFNLDSFSKRLNRINPLDVTLVSQKTNLKNGNIYLLEDTSIIISDQYGELYIQKNDKNQGFYHPTIDELFLSAAKLNDIKITAYLLSGIGSDGAKGLLALKKANFKTVAQDKETSIVYGMPKSALELQACQYVMSIDEIIDEINKETV